MSLLSYIHSITLPTLDQVRHIQVDQKHMKTIVGITAATAVLYSACKLFATPDPFDSNKGTKKIPMPDGAYPYIGHVLAFAKSPIKASKDWHRRYGPLVRVRMGVQNWLLVGDPLLAHKLFVIHGAVTSSRPHNSDLLNVLTNQGKGIVLEPYGTTWKKTRGVALSLLAPKKLDPYSGEIDKESYALIQRLISSTEKEAISPWNDLKLNSLNFISLALFGKRYESINDPEFITVSEVVVKSLEYGAFETDLSSFFPIAGVIFRNTGTAEKIRKFVETERDPILHTLIKNATEREGDNLIKAIVSDEYDFTPEEEASLAFDLLVAGTDTTATFLCWAFAILCHYPDIQDRVYEEMRSFVKKHNHLPSYTERSETPYTLSFMREVSRFRSVTNFGVPHCTTEDVIVDGYFIPANTTILTSMDTMNMTHNVFNNPEEFNPDRYKGNVKSMMASANGKIEERDHYSFGWGRRICPGAYLAELEIYSVLTKLLAECTIKPDGGLPNLEKVDSSDFVALPSTYKARFIRRT
ncbi:cytochrome P450 [Pilobolus umbonatus]|nr:cytochrome P450 [Pilobolus umbonatus]